MAHDTRRSGLGANVTFIPFLVEGSVLLGVGPRQAQALSLPVDRMQLSATAVVPACSHAPRHDDNGLGP